MSIKDLNIYLKSIESGEKVYEKIQKEHSEMVYVFPHKSLGDIFILGLYRAEYPEWFGDEYTLLVVGDRCKELAHKYGFKRTSSIIERDMQQLTAYLSYTRNEPRNIRILHFLYRHTQIAFDIAYEKGWNFLDCYAKFVFGRKLTLKKAPFQYKDLQEKKAKKLGFNKGHTVIIAPYAKSVYSLQWLFWFNMVSYLSSIGYKKIYTNCAGSEIEIPGTERISLNLDEMPGALDYAGIFISIRSGICDLMCYTECKKVILYPDKSFYRDHPLDFYTLDGIPCAKNYKEYEISVDAVSADYEKILDL